MARTDTKGKFPLTILYGCRSRKRLAVAAEAQKRSAADLVTNILDKTCALKAIPAKARFPTRKQSASQGVAGTVAALL